LRATDWAARQTPVSPRIAAVTTVTWYSFIFSPPKPGLVFRSPDNDIVCQMPRLIHPPIGRFEEDISESVAVPHKPHMRQPRKWEFALLLSPNSDKGNLRKTLGLRLRLRRYS
jgi:hypothetical protein